MWGHLPDVQPADPNQAQRPLQVNDVVAVLPAEQQPGAYRMAHLLAAGFRGSEYQLQVLLVRSLRLLIEKKGFQAGVEIYGDTGFGNLDDIWFIIQDAQNHFTIEAYQVKYYSSPITIYDLLAPKMHIGKFFNGWLKWRKAYPNLPGQDLFSILYTNTTLDPIFNQFLTNNSFNALFIQNRLRITIPRQPNVVGHVPKNFMAAPDVTVYYSTIIWNNLQQYGYINAANCLSEKYTPFAPNFRLAIPLPAHISEAQVMAALMPIYSAYQTNQVDLYDLLCHEAWQYLIANSLHPHEQMFPYVKKMELFQQFLASFRFQVAQSNIDQLENQILTDIRQLLREASEQVYLCLYYAVRAWFRKEYHPNQQTTILTDSVMRQLLQEALARSHTVILLQGRSAGTLARISCVSAESTVIRTEANELQQRLTQPDLGVIMVVGEKGIGKSGLVKQMLTRLDVSEYLAFSAADLIHEPDLQTKINTLAHITAIRIIFIDNAESLLSINEGLIRTLLHGLRNSQRIIVFTLTSEALQHSVFQIHDRIVVQLQPLPLPQVLQTYPVLLPYQHVQPIMRLAQIPFYLSAILRLLNQLRPEQLGNYMIENDNTRLKDTLIKLVMRGETKHLKKPRQLAAQQLALAIAQSTANFLGEITIQEKFPGLDMLIADGFVMQQQKIIFPFGLDLLAPRPTQPQECYQFSHELFFEHALMSFWLKEWESAHTQNRTSTFWQNLKEYLQNYMAKSVFKKWVAQYLESYRQFTDDIVAQITVIAQQPYFNSLVTIAIATDNTRLIQCCLQNSLLELNTVSNVEGFYSTTWVYTAIEYNATQCLQCLLQNNASLHHPHAGRFIQNMTDFTSYYEVESEQTTSSSAEESDESEYDYFGNDSSSGDSDTDSSEEERKYKQVEEDQEKAQQELTEKFVTNPYKYWQAGFDEELGWYDDDDGDWIANNKYQHPSDFAKYYLHLIVKLNRTSCLTIFLNNHQQRDQAHAIHLKNEYKETPLHIAALQNTVDAARCLLDHGAAIYHYDEWNETALHNAVYVGNVELARLLLQRNASPNELIIKGVSPLHIALIQLNFKFVELLFTYGADFSLAPLRDVKTGLTIADLLLSKYKCQTHQRPAIEEFVMQLVALLNYGRDDQEFTWRPEPRAIASQLELRQAQLEQAHQLMPLIQHRVQLSRERKGFDPVPLTATAEVENILEGFDHLDLNATRTVSPASPGFAGVFGQRQPQQNLYEGTNVFRPY